MDIYCPWERLYELRQIVCFMSTSPGTADGNEPIATYGTKCVISSDTNVFGTGSSKLKLIN